MKKAEEMRQIKRAIAESSSHRQAQYNLSKISSDLTLLEDGSVKTADGKVIKKKTIPKKKVADASGGLDWEVIDKKRTVIVEEDENQAASDTD